MKRHMLAAVIILLLGLLATSVAWAHRSHHGHGYRGPAFHGHGYKQHGHRHTRVHSHASVGIILGGPLVWPGYYHYRSYPRYSYYGYPPVVVTSPPVIYIERDPPPAPQAVPGYWHYCPNPQGYYPYVKECPAGWQAVPAQPPRSP